MISLMNSWEHLRRNCWLQGEHLGMQCVLAEHNNLNTCYIHDTEIPIYSLDVLIGASGVTVDFKLRKLSREVERNSQATP
jgi:hypothetical protein